MRTVLSEMSSTTLKATSSSANICMVHLARPSGGVLQAIAISLASPRPSSFRATAGVSRFFRSRAASSPCSTKRCRTLATVLGWHRKDFAMSSSFMFGPFSSAASKMLACLIRYAAPLPFETTASNCSRSSDVSPTMKRFFRHLDLPCSKRNPPTKKLSA